MINKLGDFLKQQRGNSSLRVFAEKLDISHTHLDSLEKGVDPRTGKPVRVTVDTLKKIADKLQIDFIYLTKLSINENDIEATTDYLLGREEIKIQTIAAHYEGDKWSKEEEEEIEKFKQFILAKRNKG